MPDQIILSVDDFNRILDDYAGRQISHQVVTITTSNITGEEDLSYASASNIKAYFMRYGQNWDFQKAGFVEKGDAVMLSKYADAVKKDDRVTVNGEIFRVKERFDVPGVFDSDGVATYVYTSCNLFLIQ